MLLHHDELTLLCNRVLDDCRRDDLRGQALEIKVRLLQAEGDIEGARALFSMLPAGLLTAGLATAGFSGWMIGRLFRGTAGLISFEIAQNTQNHRKRNRGKTAQNRGSTVSQNRDFFAKSCEMGISQLFFLAWSSESWYIFVSRAAEACLAVNNLHLSVNLKTQTLDNKIQLWYN